MITQIDLHTHTTASDGTLTPTELVDLAVAKNLSTIAITDHDSMDGVYEAYERARFYKEQGVDIEVIGGMELSSDYHGKDIHIVGLFLDPDSDYLKRRMEAFRQSREKRNIEMCERLTQGGMPITYEEMLNTFPNSVLTRAHFAKMLVMKGFVSSNKEAFDRFIGDGKPYFVTRKKKSPYRAIEIVRKAGGFPILAHPMQYKMGESTLTAFVKTLKDSGLMGIEAIYSTHTPSDEREIRRIAAEFDLAISGGSDFHGTNKPTIDLGCGTGHLFVPSDLLTVIKARHSETVNSDSSEGFNLPKILFTDLDGTLLRDDKTISEYTYDVLRRFTEQGNFLVLCTGRDINSVNKVYHDLGFDKFKNVYTIAYNGGQIYDCSNKKTLFKTTLKKEDVSYIMAEAKKDDLYFQTYSDTNVITYEETEESRFYARVIKTPYIFTDDIEGALDSDGPCKCLMIDLHDKNKTDHFIERMTPWADEHNISLMYSNPHYVEAFPSTSGKGASVDILCKQLSIPGLIPICAGDEENDISMLNAADVAIGMLNGIPAIHNAASLVTAYDNNNDGLAHELEDFM